jgi:hypothetical protein
MCVAALRQDFANTPPALASNMGSSRLILPRRGKELIHTSHRLRVKWLIGHTPCEARPKAAVVLFPSHAKHRALSWIFTGAAGCKRCEQCIITKLGTRQRRTKRKSSLAHCPFPRSARSSVCPICLATAHLCSNQSQVCKNDWWRPRNMHLLLRSPSREPALWVRLRPPFP